MKPLLLATFLLLFYTTTIACDCARSPKTFVASIKQYTAELEVAQIDTLGGADIDPKYPIVLTKLKVIRTFKKSNVMLDYIWMDNSAATDCQQGLFPEKIGQRFIITGQLFEDKRYPKWHKGEQRTFLFVTSCGNAVLEREGDIVFGEINKNNEEKIKAKYDTLMKTDATKAEAYYFAVYNTKHHKDLVQTMPIDQFYRLMGN